MTDEETDVELREAELLDIGSTFPVEALPTDPRNDCAIPPDGFLDALIA
jgi:hypothetical protein